VGRLTTILRYQWTAYARRAFRAGSGRGSAGVLLLALGVFFYRYLQMLPKAAGELGAGGLPGRLGGLVWKDVRDFTRLLDFYLALLVAAWAALYLAYAEDPSRHLLHAALIGVPLFNLSAAFNYFGLETPSGFDRYTLLPLSGRDVILCKNLAFAALVAAPLCPSFLLAAWRFGAVEGLVCLAEVALLSAAYLVWGNAASVGRPFRMQPFRFSSGGPPVEMFAGAVFGSLPGVRLTYLLYQGGGGGAWKLLLTALACGALYLLSLRKAAASFGRRREDLRRRLT
jgi:hypothetical protein